MKSQQSWLRVLVMLAFLGGCFPAAAGTWADHFSEEALGADWQGDRDYFSIDDGTLKGISATPVAPAPFNRVEVGKDWADYTVQCRVNVVEPNLLVCSKGALILRDNGTDGYVFALHVATKTIEVYRLSFQEMLLSKEAPLELKTWYLARAELQGETMRFFVDGQLIGTVTDTRSLSGRVGVAVQDVMDARFDGFVVSGTEIPGNGLELNADHKTLTITWPSSMPDYVLKSTAQLSPTAVWDTVTNVPRIDGDLFRVTVDASAGSRYYRLVPANP